MKKGAGIEKCINEGHKAYQANHISNDSSEHSKLKFRTALCLLLILEHKSARIMNREHLTTPESLRKLGSSVIWRARCSLKAICQASY